MQKSGLLENNYPSVRSQTDAFYVISVREAPRRYPEAPKRHPVAPRRHPEGTRRHPGETQEAPRGHPGGTQRHPGGTREPRSGLEANCAKFIVFFCRKLKKRPFGCRGAKVHVTKRGK